MVSYPVSDNHTYISTQDFLIRSLTIDLYTKAFQAWTPFKGLELTNTAKTFGIFEIYTPGNPLSDPALIDLNTRICLEAFVSTGNIPHLVNLTHNTNSPAHSLWKLINLLDTAKLPVLINDPNHLVREFAKLILKG